MSINMLVGTQPRPTVHKLLSVPDGALMEILASPEEVGDEICLIRGTLPPGVAVPLHSHPDLEVFYILNGTAESFQSKGGKSEWTTVGEGAVVVVPGNVKHAWRNTSSLPATVVLVTTANMYRFFSEITKPFDPSRRPAAPTPEEMNKLFTAAARYGFWMASPEENATIGITLLINRGQKRSD